MSHRLNLRSSNENVDLQNLSIYYTWENIRKYYRNNKLKIIAPPWNDEFELPHGSSASDLQDYMEIIIKKHETLTTISSIHVYIKRINNRLVFKLKYGLDNLELQTSETIQLFGSTK